MYVYYAQPIQVLTLSWMSPLAPAATSTDAKDSCPFIKPKIRAVLPSYFDMTIGDKLKSFDAKNYLL